MPHTRLIRIALLIASPCLSMFAQTNLVVNGSFEQGLANWSFFRNDYQGAEGNCSYNATAAPGTETLTGTAGFPATDGTHVVLGSVTTFNSLRIQCVLYQDIAIPLGATTATLLFDLGVKAGNGCAKVGLFSPAAGGGFGPIGAPATICPSGSALTTDVGIWDVSSVAGTTVRLAFFNDSPVTADSVVGIDNVRLFAAVSAPTVTSVSPNSGPATGGNTVTITGTSFTGATSVTFAGTPATSFTVVNATTITATVPGGAAGGPASVIVTTPAGSNPANALYAYVMPVPTLGEWGMIGLTALLILYGCFRLRRQDDMQRQKGAAL